MNKETTPKQQRNSIHDNRVTHRMKPGGPFGFEAQCGATKPPDYPLLTTSTATSVNCDDCKRIAGDAQQHEEQVPPERVRLWMCKGCQNPRLYPDCHVCGDELIHSTGYTRDDAATTGAVSIPDAKGQPMNDFEARAGIATRKIRERLERPKREAARIAAWMANTFYPQQEFALLDTLSGILSQIDNMLVGTARRVPIPDAISVVEKMRDEWLPAANTTDNEDLAHARGLVDASEAIITRLRSLSPSVGVETDAVCTWSALNNGYWSTCGPCGLKLGSSLSNLGINFCCFCGKRLVERRAATETEEG